jgi:enoyl-CoA hydratase/carnithine racemase
LVNAVVEDVRAEADAWATRIAGYPPVGVQATKRLMLFSRAALADERREVEEMRAFVETHDDYKQGAAAFVGKPQR